MSDLKKEKKEGLDECSSCGEGKVQTPASDLYGEIEGKDPETCVEIPTEEAVEEAREWTEENQR